MGQSLSESTALMIKLHVVLCPRWNHPRCFTAARLHVSGSTDQPQLLPLPLLPLTPAKLPQINSNSSLFILLARSPGSPDKPARAVRLLPQQGVLLMQHAASVPVSLT